MKLVVSGLSAQSEKTLGFFIDRMMKRWSWASAPARSTALPRADAYVIDLVAWGLGQWSEQAQSRLIELIQGTPAILLASTHERSWENLDSKLATRLGLFSVFKPYRSEEMRDALDRIAAQLTKSEPLPEIPAIANTRPSPVKPMVAPAISSVPRDVPVAPVVTLAPVAKANNLQKVHEPHTHEHEAPGLTVQELQKQLEAIPDREQHSFLRKLADMLQTPKPLEVRFTIQNLMIVHPQDGWVVSNTPMQVIERVSKSKALASVVNMRHIEVKDAEDWAQRLHAPIVELEPFLLQLATAAFAEPPITALYRA
jgi:hypothetical protein